MWLFILLCLLFAFWRLCVTKRPRNYPPGPALRVPLLGHAFHVGSDSIKGFQRLRERYGDIFHLELGPFNGVVVNELKLLEEMMGNPALSGRVNLDELYKCNFNRDLRGGQGYHGIIASSGSEWQEQRRFTIRHLRDLGFGKSSMEEIILEECNDLVESFREKAHNEEDISTNMIFHNSVLNVIWHIISGKRFNLDDLDQGRRLNLLSKMFQNCNATDLKLMVGFLMPESLQKRTEIYKNMKQGFSELFAWFDQEYQEHKETYDSNDHRDLIDAYIGERERVLADNDTESSFHGESGHWNFVNSMFDLFLAGAETTSTTLTFFILYMLHYPDVQQRAQDEIDSVVGRSRAPSLTDRDNMPYLEAVLSEIQRRSNVAFQAIPHMALEDAKVGNYVIPKGTIIFPNLAAIMLDPANFPDPLKMDPGRFHKEDKYHAHPALIPFGIGKRYCPGKSLASLELFLFMATLLHQFTFERSPKGLIGMDDVTLSITRVPKPFFFRVKSRN